MVMQTEVRILVVDSNEATRMPLQSMLLRHGYLVTLANDIAEALAVFEPDPCPLVISAFKLRDGGGVDLIPPLRQHHPPVSVILVGGRSLEAALEALRSNCTDYLPRPVSEEALLGALDRALRTYAAQLEHMASAQALAARLNRLQAAQSSLVQIASLAALGRLAASLAHEINNPLTPIFGMAELLLDDLPQDHSCRPYAEAIAASARRIRNVVRSLIDFARPAVQEHTQLDLGPLIRDTLLLTEQQLHNQSIATIVTLPAEPVMIMGSPAQLKQALLLLIDNAREAMPKGGRLTITLSTAQPGEGQLDARGAVVAIDDTGVGIAEQHIPFIFEPFYSTKPQVVGVGLGLAVASSIVKEHGGTIEVASVLGQGSTFRIALPPAE